MPIWFSLIISGRILNRFTRDTEFMDNTLPIEMQIVYVVRIVVTDADMYDAFTFSNKL